MEGFVEEYFDQNPISQVGAHQGSAQRHPDFCSVHFPSLNIRDL